MISYCERFLTHFLFYKKKTSNLQNQCVPRMELAAFFSCSLPDTAANTDDKLVTLLELDAIDGGGVVLSASSWWLWCWCCWIVEQIELNVFCDGVTVPIECCCCCCALGGRLLRDIVVSSGSRSVLLGETRLISRMSLTSPRLLREPLAVFRFGDETVAFECNAEDGAIANRISLTSAIERVFCCCCCSCSCCWYRKLWSSSKNWRFALLPLLLHAVAVLENVVVLPVLAFILSFWSCCWWCSCSSDVTVAALNFSFQFWHKKSAKCSLSIFVRTFALAQCSLSRIKMSYALLTDQTGHLWSQWFRFRNSVLLFIFLYWSLARFQNVICETCFIIVLTSVFCLICFW